MLHPNEAPPNPEHLDPDVVVTPETPGCKPSSHISWQADLGQLISLSEP